MNLARSVRIVKDPSRPRPRPLPDEVDFAPEPGCYGVAAANFRRWAADPSAQAAFERSTLALRAADGSIVD